MGPSKMSYNIYYKRYLKKIFKKDISIGVLFNKYLKYYFKIY